jgi:hypothetical protein
LARLLGNAYAGAGGGPNGDLRWEICGGIGYDVSQTIAGRCGRRRVDELSGTV